MNVMSWQVLRLCLGGQDTPSHPISMGVIHQGRKKPSLYTPGTTTNGVCRSGLHQAGRDWDPGCGSVGAVQGGRSCVNILKTLNRARTVRQLPY